MDFTEEQLSIITHSTGHARVSAVAGSGKTTTMVGRVGYLIERGVPPGDILILMFNKSARDSFAQSMQVRLGHLKTQLPEVRTFHALGKRLVDSFVRRGVLPAYRLVTEDFVLEKLARQAAMQTYRTAAENDTYLAAEEVEEFLTFIDLVKADTKSAADVFREQNLSLSHSYFIAAFDFFEEVRKNQGLRFFADLIYDPLVAMLQSQELLSWVCNRVSHIIVDEYQDINQAQQQLLKILAGKRAQVMVVGDVDQCIYEWRGARPDYMTERFQVDFANPKTFLLSYTFRYGHALSLAANHVIANNRERDEKLCISHVSNASSVISCCGGEHAAGVVTCLHDWQNRGRSLSEAAVLVRLYAQSVAVELALLQANVPYRLLGNAQVFECPEILALTGYLHLAAGGLAELETGLREKTVSAMLSQPHLGLKREEMAGLAGRICADPDNAVLVLEDWRSAELPGFIAARFDEAADNWRYISAQTAELPAGEFLKTIVRRLQLFDFYHKFSARTAVAENRIKTCEAFIEFALAQKLTVPGFLEKIAGMRLADDKLTAETLLITSIHRAKGLEWPLVILPGLEEGFFPLYRDRQSVQEHMEDERRLFYVAMTRAQEQLVCLHPLDAMLSANIRHKKRKVPDQPIRASRFLYEAHIGLSSALGECLEKEEFSQPLSAEDVQVSNRYLDSIGKKIKLKEVSVKGGDSAESSSRLLTIADVQEGMKVLHPVFGNGEVIAIKDKKQGRVEVHFNEQGRTVLLMAYARLRSSGSAV